jgi:hypothetical protein
MVLPDGRKLAVLGKVKRVQRGADEGMGIYFVHPESEGVKALQALVAAEANDGPAGTAQKVVDKAKDELAEENLRLLTRISKLEDENREFVDQLIEIEQVNTNLYIASTALFSSSLYGVSERKRET